MNKDEFSVVLKNINDCIYRLESIDTANQHVIDLIDEVRSILSYTHELVWEVAEDVAEAYKILDSIMNGYK